MIQFLNIVNGFKNNVANSRYYSVNRFMAFTNTSWNVASNWSYGRVPTSAENASIDRNCTLNINPTILNLTVSAGVTLTFGGTARTLNVNGNFNCQGTINMNSASHVLSLRGNFNNCNSIVNSTTSTVDFRNDTSSPFGIPNKTVVSRGFSTLRNLTLSRNVGTGGQFTQFIFLTNINVLGNYLHNAGIRASYQELLVQGTSNLNSGAQAGESIFGQQLVIFLGSTSFPPNPFSLNGAFEFRHSTVTLNNASFVTNSSVYFTTNNKVLTVVSPKTITNLIVENITVNKAASPDPILTITNLSGTASAVLNGNSRTTVANNLGGITYNP